MVEVYPLPDQEAATCITAVYNGMFSRFGVPRQLHSDQSRNFESQLVTERQDYSVPPAVRWIDRTSQSGHTGYSTCRHIQRHKAVAVEASFSVGRLPNDGTLNHRSDTKSSSARKRSAVTSIIHCGASGRKHASVRICARLSGQPTSSTPTSSSSHV